MESKPRVNRYEFNDPFTGSYFYFTNDLARDLEKVLSNPTANRIFWNTGKGSFGFRCDDKNVVLRENEFCTLTALNYLEVPDNDQKIAAIAFNREFYCIRDHDHEVSCNGILFYGAQDFSVLKFPPADIVPFQKLTDLFMKEFQECDSLHGEMLVSLLKILIIRLTRIGRNQITAIQSDNQSIEIIRKYNLLVEENFRKWKQISEYSFILNISSKKLSELFRIAKLDPPLQTIHKRVILEAKRMLLFTLKSINEISDELGFEDASHFSKLFKKLTGKSPSKFRSQKN
ncbi:helix-turn-helix domain-containing protein [Leptospira bouyouniensis]|uniref:helix-turn-helix domain-containing protein n=1 Tax=Leptospira bouyouniensis TaxID=2484911 RepID=UPI001090FEB8|nr:AraC family transcriptional regulator [Leptospira bouyouniensis]TGM80091.1 helix-turn-helix domain-containing protein [Leptospira bouyouniensis]